MRGCVYLYTLSVCAYGLASMCILVKCLSTRVLRFCNITDNNILRNNGVSGSKCNISRIYVEYVFVVNVVRAAVIRSLFNICFKYSKT